MHISPRGRTPRWLAGAPVYRQADLQGWALPFYIDHKNHNNLRSIKPRRGIYTFTHSHIYTFPHSLIILYLPMMKTRFLYSIAILCTFFLISATVQTDFPQASISNGIISARFYLPDSAKGYYRGTRFDWSGVIPELTYKDHGYCSQWFSNYSPTMHDAIMGPVESFTPLGYEAAKAGGRFVQVGVGILSKTNDNPYSPFTYYPMLDAGDWAVQTTPASIAFTHTLKDADYGYHYTKTETLLEGKPVLQLTHHLQNNGQQEIQTAVYNHNLFVLDKQSTGPGADITFPFRLEGDPQGQKGFGDGNLAMIKGKQIVFNRDFQKKESVYTVLNGYGKKEKDYDIKIENHRTGAAVRITSNRPLSKLVFWGSSTIYSPEPYIQVNIRPGESFDWTTTYEFYTCKTSPLLSQ